MLKHTSQSSIVFHKKSVQTLVCTAITKVETKPKYLSEHIYLKSYIAFFADVKYKKGQTRRLRANTQVCPYE